MGNRPRRRSSRSWPSRWLKMLGGLGASGAGWSHQKHAQKIPETSDFSIAENCWFKIWLVVWNMNFIFPYIGKNHSKWRTHIFQRGRYTTNQKWWVCEWCLMFPGCSNGEPRKVLEGINGTIFAYGPQHSIRDPRDPVRVEPREVVKWLLFHSHLTLLKELSHLAVHEMLA